MDTILSYRQQFYERSYDLRIICPRNETVEKTAKRIVKALNRWGPEKGGDIKPIAVHICHYGIRSILWVILGNEMFSDAHNTEAFLSSNCMIGLKRRSLFCTLYKL